MREKTAGVVRTSLKVLGLLSLIIVLFAGCSGGGSGGGGGAKSSDADLQKIADEFKKLGNGHWEITSMEREGDVVNISMRVGDDPGKVTFKEGQAAEEAVHKIIPRASGKLSWISVQGVGLRAVLMEAVEGAPDGGAGAPQGGETAEHAAGEHSGEHEGGK